MQFAKYAVSVYVAVGMVKESELWVT